MNSYAEVLESYLIPAEEGFMDKVKAAANAIINAVIAMIKRLVNKIIAGVNYLKNKIKKSRDRKSDIGDNASPTNSVSKVSSTVKKDNQAGSATKALPDKAGLNRKLNSATEKLVSSSRKINSTLNKMCSRAYSMTKSESISQSEIDGMEAGLDNILEDMTSYIDDVEAIYDDGGRLTEADALKYMVGLKADIALLNTICSTFEKMQQDNQAEDNKKVIDQLCKSVKHAITISATVVDMVPSLCR